MHSNRNNCPWFVTASLCGLLWLLAGCATVRPVKIQTVDVPVLVETKCITKDQVPQRPSVLASDKPPEFLEDALALALTKISEWTRFGNQADKLLKTCAS